MVGRIEQVLRALESAGVRCLVAGGVAVVLHGHLRTTADLDLMLDLEGDGAGSAIRALADAGFRPRAPVAIEEFADAEIRRRWVEEKNLEVFSLWNPRMPGFEVDLFVHQPIAFGDAWSRRVEVDTGRCRISVVSLGDLITMKRQAGRPRDLGDIAALEAIARLEEERRGGE